MAEIGELACPKCESPMRSYERNGIVVDQCTGCKGIFLDRGELEQLMAAETAHYEGGESGEEKGIVGKMRDRAEQKLHEQQQRQQGHGRERGERGEGGFLGGMFGGDD